MKFIHVARLLMACFLTFISVCTQAQVKGTFFVGGDIDKYYPVVFTDSAWEHNEASELQIGRSSIHRDSLWRGALIATFRYHGTNFGNGANFFDADIRQNSPGYKKFIGGWSDPTRNNNERTIIIWLRGNTSYDYSSRYKDKVKVYDGTPTGPLPYIEPGTLVQHTFKTVVDSYVNTDGSTISSSTYSLGALNYFSGNVGIGTLTPNTYKLAVEGTLGARRIKVTSQPNWADFVFHPDYKLPALTDVEQFIQQNGHLPEIPTAAEVNENGVDVGEMNKLLLQKVEEMTLYLIQQQKEINELKRLIKKQ